MSSVINFNSPTTLTFGNITPYVKDINAAVDGNISSIKTMVNGSWKSWTKGAPSAFQGFIQLEPGVGYVATSTGLGSITLFNTTEKIDVMDIPVSLGGNFIAYPKPDTVSTSPRFDSNVAKTIIDGQWRSWTAGAPDAFQGFLTYNTNNGYYVNVTKIYGSSTSYDPYDGPTGFIPYALAFSIATEYLGLDLTLNNYSTGYRYSFY
jgi:hypothetical protein